MSSRRPAILMGILLALTLGYLAKPYYLRLTAPARPAIQPPLPGENSISGLKVKRNLKGAWVADFDYFHRRAGVRRFRNRSRADAS